MDLSVIIVSWNTKEDLLRCVESILRKREDGPRQVIVVDNGSRDGSGTAVRETFSIVHLIENDRNRGFSKAANQGLKVSPLKYALLLNPDTRVREGAIARLVSFMDSHPDAGVAGAQLLNPDGSKQNSIANFPSLATELLNKSLLRWLFPRTFPGKERSYPGPIEVDSVIGASMIVRREVMERVGMLDEDYFLFFEETDWCYRIKKAGWKIYHVPLSEIYHFQGKSAAAEKKKAKVEYYRARYRFFRKHRGRLQELVLHFGLVARLAVELIFSAGVCLFTFFSRRRLRERFVISAYLLLWHMRFCPKEMGLEPVE